MMKSHPPASIFLRRFLPPALMVLLTLVALHPLPWRMATEVLYSTRDQNIFLWNMWWVQHAVTTLHQSPFTTDYLFAPEGVSLSYHTLCSAGGFIGILFGSAINLLLAHNLLLLLSFILSGWFTYLLVLELSHSRSGALFAAILFAFGTARWQPVYNGQMHIYATQWMPLFLLAMIWFLQKPKLKSALLAAVALAAIFYSSYQQVVFTFMLATLILPTRILTEFKYSDRSFRKRLLVGTALFFVVLAMLAAPLATEMWKHRNEARIQTNPVEWHTMAVSADRLLSGMNYYREWTRGESTGPLAPVWRLIKGLPPKSGPILGYTTVIVILIGWFGLLWPSGKGGKRWPIVYWSLALIPLFWIMLGPEPKLFGIQIPSLTPLMRAVPGFQSIRSAIRYSIPLSLAAAILVGYIFARWNRIADSTNSERSVARSKRCRILFTVLSLLAVVVLYLEFLRVPVRTVRPPAPPAVYLAGGAVHIEHEADSDSGTLLELPYWYAGGGYKSETVRFSTLYFQTIHQRKMAGGHVSRLIPSAVPHSIHNPVLFYLSHRRPFTVPEPDMAQVEEFHSLFDVRFINVTRREYRPEAEWHVRAFLEQRLQAELISADEAFLVYRVPDSPAIGG